MEVAAAGEDGAVNVWRGEVREGGRGGGREGGRDGRRADMIHYDTAFLTVLSSPSFPPSLPPSDADPAHPTPSGLVDRPLLRVAYGR